MLGHRGAAWGWPARKFTNANPGDFSAAPNYWQRFPPDKIGKIMIPLVGHLPELIGLRALIEQTAKEILSNGYHLDYLIVPMVELPRACLIADWLQAVFSWYQ